MKVLGISGSPRREGNTDILVSIPVHRGKVKPYYVRQVEKLREGG